MRPQTIALFPSFLCYPEWWRWQIVQTLIYPAFQSMKPLLKDQFAFRPSGLTTAAITASTVQGSGAGPSEYDISASDLHPLNASNIFVKFANDTYLISSAATCHTISDEIEGVHRWTTKNSRLNSSKSTEMTERGLIVWPRTVLISTC